MLAPLLVLLSSLLALPLGSGQTMKQQHLSLASLAYLTMMLHAAHPYPDTSILMLSSALNFPFLSKKKKKKCIPFLWLIFQIVIRMSIG